MCRHFLCRTFSNLKHIFFLLEDEKNQSHRDLRDALLNMQMFPGVTGNLRFDENGKVERKMQLLTLRRGKIQPLN